MDAGTIEATLTLKNRMTPELIQAERDVDKFTGVLSNMGTSWTRVAGLATTAAATVAAGAGAIGAAITALGVRGSAVDDVTNAFADLTRGMGRADKVLDGLRGSVDGVVSDFDLMKSVNLALSQGLKLTTSELETTGEAARVLADRIGGDTKEAYDTLLQALATGQDRTLKTIGVNIDAAAAVDTFAASLGKSASELSEQDQLLAKQQALMRELTRVVQTTGGVEADFADRIDQAKVAVRNFTDDLARTVATSPKLTEAMNDAGEAVLRAFGGNRDAAIKKVAGAIESVATMAARAVEGFAKLPGPAQVAAIGIAGITAVAVPAAFAVGRLAEMLLALQASGALTALAKLAPFAAGAAAVGLGGLGVGAILAKRDMDRFLNQNNERTPLGDAPRFDDAGKAIGAFDLGIKGLGISLETAKQGLNGFSAATGASGTAAKLTKEELERLKAIQDHLYSRDLIKQAQDYAGQITHVGDVLRFLPPIQQEVFDTMDQAVQAYEAAGSSAPGHIQAIRDALYPTVVLQKQLHDAVNRTVVDFTKLGRSVSLIPPIRTQVIGSVKDIGTSIKEGTLEAAAQQSIIEQLENAYRVFGLRAPSELQRVADAARKAFETIDKSGTATKEQREEALRQLVAAEKAAAGEVAKTWGTTFDKIADKIAGVISAAGSGPRALAQATLGLIPGIGPIFSALGGLIPNGPNKALQDVLDQIHELGGTPIPLSKGNFPNIGKQLEDLQAEKRLREALAQLQGDQANALDKLNAAVERYGFTIEELGPKWKQLRITEQAQQLLEDFTLLTGSGIDLNKVIEKMAPSINEFFQLAKRTGSEIPENLKPMLQKMVDMGLLTDEAGNLITDLEDAGVNFSVTLAQGFQSVIDKLDELIRTITGDLGNAIENIPPLDDAVRRAVPKDLEDVIGKGGRRAAVLDEGNGTTGRVLDFGSTSQPRSRLPIQLVLTNGKVFAEGLIEDVGEELIDEVRRKGGFA